MTKQLITPHFWYDREAREAAEFYVSTFGGDSRIHSSTTLNDTPSGQVEIVTFDLLGIGFMAMSAGPTFKFNPSVSFHVKCKTKDEVDAIWARLSDGGKVLMELGEYPFSERFGWTEDRYGLSWQLICTGDGDIEPRIVPALLFVGEVCGKAREAVKFYTDVFPDGKVDFIQQYGKGADPEKEGTIQYADFTLAHMRFGAMDSALDHGFAFNEAISFVVNCETQAEIDYYWEKLSAVPEAEQCGWLKDKFGLSWQIVPAAMDELMGSGDADAIARVTEAFLPMKKLDISKLEKAAAGR